MLEQDSGEEFIGAEVPGTSLCPIEAVNVGAETGEGGLASEAKTDNGGSAGWADSGGARTRASGAETKAGASVETGAAMVE